MADVFTVNTIKQNDTITAWHADCKTYLDTLTATDIDSIQVTIEGHRLLMVVISHA